MHNMKQKLHNFHLKPTSIRQSVSRPTVVRNCTPTHSQHLYKTPHDMKVNFRISIYMVHSLKAQWLLYVPLCFNTEHLQQFLQLQQVLLSVHSNLHSIQITAVHHNSTDSDVIRGIQLKLFEIFKSI